MYNEKIIYKANEKQNENSLSYWLAASRLEKAGPIKILRWLEQFKSIENLFTASADAWREAGINAEIVKQLSQPDLAWVEKELNWADQKVKHIITYDDERYPAQLKEIADPPLVIYVYGNPFVLSQKQIAVVGSRRATPAGLRIAKHFAEALSQAGLTVTSGLAQGIDGAAHLGALNANGRTIGVAGTGLYHVYPKCHRKLVDDIVEKGGAVISDFPLDTSPQPANFPRRNRIIAGLSLGVLVVESALKSGSLITARLSAEAGREVFAIPGSIAEPLARGCHHLIRQGAKLVETVQDVTEELGLTNTRLSSELSLQHNEKFNNLSQNEMTLLKEIGYEITPLDVIISRSGLTPEAVSSMLLSLELSGYVQSVAGGYTRVVT